jgi:hypothetical protein
MKASIVTIAAGREGHLSRQREALAFSAPAAAHEHVVVPMRPDARGDLPLARARNAGAARALAGGAELLVFLDVDCIPAPRLLARYARAADRAPDALLCGPVSYLPPAPPRGYDLRALAELAPPHPARPAPPDGELRRGGDHRLFWSLSFAVTTATWSRLGGFYEGYTGYGAEDTDLGERARRGGVELCWVGGALASHQHHPVSSPPVEHVDAIVRNAALFQRRWGWWPMEGWLEELEAVGLVRRDPWSGAWSRAPHRLNGRAPRPTASRLSQAGQARRRDPRLRPGPEADETRRSTSR